MQLITVRIYVTSASEGTLTRSQILSTTAAIFGNKPTGGPASASVTIYPGPYTCVDGNTVPPTDGTAGKGVTVSVTENQCVIVNIVRRPHHGHLRICILKRPALQWSNHCNYDGDTQDWCCWLLHPDFQPARLWCHSAESVPRLPVQRPRRWQLCRLRKDSCSGVRCAGNCVWLSLRKKRRA